MMESFCKTIENETLREDMLANVKCKAGEKLFSKDIIKYKLEEKWAAYKNGKYEETISKWSKKFNVGI
jgi:CRISPR/Cas system CSM-associated protein Csm5 (group 7 of RAMP superfamily)